MKLQHLSIIFIVIILPISLVLSTYVKNQSNALRLQTEYDSKLNNATYDAVKAFQSNTLNESTSGIANSKIKIIEASANAFFNSLSRNFGVSGYSTNSLKQYVPALVFIMYDGYYIYTPFDNRNDLGINDDGKTIYGLKPYVYYSCRYKDGNNDVVITYSLDNYITIQGNNKGQYINISGYLLTNAKVEGNGVTYDGQEIATEMRTQSLNGYSKKLPYIKENGITYYWDQEKKRVFYLLNGTEIDSGMTEGKADYNTYVQKIQNNNSAILYYQDAYYFTKYVQNNFGWVTTNKAYDKNGNKLQLSDSAAGDTKIFSGYTANNPIEYENSAFNIHRQAVIRNSIETNLAVAIAGYNKYTQSSTNFQMPKLQEDEWNIIMNNVSLISFMQGLNAGGNIYNGYSIVTNHNNKEVVQEEDIYIVDSKGEYHKITDIDLQNSDKVLNDNVYGALKLDFEPRSTVDNNGNKVYYYPETATACYKCIVNSKNTAAETDGGIYEYLRNLSNTQKCNTLKQRYYTALGRERYGSRKQSKYMKIGADSIPTY